jgi:predicted PurR-regulated permease PerM
MRNENVQHGFFFLLLVLVTLAFLGLLWDFLEPIFWAAVLAVLFHGLQKRNNVLLRGRSSLASLTTITVILIIVILPLLLMGAAVTREAVILYDRISSGELETLTRFLGYMEETLPTLTSYVQRLEVDLADLQQRLSSAGLVVGRFFASKAVEIGQNALRIGLLLVLMVYVLFFFLRDGDRLIEMLIRFLPLGDVRERRLLGRFAAVSRATIKGVLVVSVIQGALGGLLFWVVGIGAPVFWGMIMSVLSFLPAVGPAVVWVPAGVILIVNGNVLEGIVVFAAGSLIIGLVDNLLRPILVGRDTKMPDFLVLLSTIGGLAVFGISGFVIGPMIAALFITVWEMFGQEYVEDEIEGKSILTPPSADSGREKGDGSE